MKLYFATLGAIFGLAVLTVSSALSGVTFSQLRGAQNFGAQPALIIAQGGTGTTTFQTNSIPYTASALRFTEDNANFSYNGTKLIVKNASTTNLSATAFCLTGDICRTTWPSASGGAATTSFAATAPIQVNQGAAAITYSILAASASQAGSMAAGDFQRLYTATTTFSAPLTYTLGTNAVTCPTCGSGAPEFTVTLLNSFNTTTLATTTSLWTKGVYFASSTVAASVFPLASSTLSSVSSTFWVGDPTVAGDATEQFGPIGQEWSIGRQSSTNNFVISSSTALGTLNALTISRTVGTSLLTFAYASTTNITATTASTTNLYVSGAPNALALMGVDGLLGKYAGASACGANNFVTALSAVGGTTCGTATISGISLGSNLAAHTVSGSLTGTSYNGSASVSDWALNMANANSWTATQTFKNASSTNLSASGFLGIPTTIALPTTLTQSQLVVNTTAASTSLQFGAAAVYATTSVAFTWATTSPSTVATDTIMIMNGPRGVKFDNIACRTTSPVFATTTVAIGTGIATSTYVIASSTATFTTLSTNNSFNSLQTIYIAIGGYSYLGVSQISCGLGEEYTY